MKNHNFNSRYIILTLTIATLLAFFVMQAGAVTTVTTPITGTVDTTRSGDIQILVSSDGSTISSDAGGDGIYADKGWAVSIDKMSGGPDALAISADYFGIHVVGQSGDVQIGSGIGELTINSGRNGIVVETGSSTVGGTVSSDANLVINSSVTGVNNYGGTVDLTGVSIDVMGGNGIDTQLEQSVTRIRPSAGYHTISADNNGINVGQSGDVLIGRGSGSGELTINSGSDGDGVSVGSNGTVSSDADLVIKSGGDGVKNSGGTVNLAGVSIDSNSNGINTSGTQSVTRVRPSTGYHTISADYNGIYVSQSGDVQIGRGDGELTINSGGSYNAGVWVENGTVSSDADLVITSGGDGVKNSGGTVNLAGVSIDAKQGNGIVNLNSGSTVISGDQALIRAATSGAAAYAITNSGGSVSVKTSGDVLLAAKSNASLSNASSLISNPNGTVSIDAGGQVTFDVTAQSARGLYNTASPAFGDGVTVTAAKGVNYAATATSGDAYGIEAANSAALNYGKVNNVAVTATGGDAYGLAALSRGTLSGDGANSISNVSVTENTADKTAYGVYASGDSKVAGISIDQLTVKSAGSAYGVNIASDKASSIDITNGLTVSGADANGGAGIYITGAGHSVNVGGALKATGVQYGVYNSGGAVNLAGVSIDAKGSGVSVNGDGQSIVSISPASGYDTINADDSGIAVNNSGKVLIGKGSGTLNINSGAHGVYAADGGIVSSDADLVIKSSGRGVFNHGGTVNLAGVSIDAKNDLGIYNKGGSLVISGDQTLVKAETTGSSAAYAISNSNNNSKSGSVSIDAVSVQLTARSAHGAAAAISNTGSGAVSIDTGAGGMELIVSAASGDAAAVSNTGGGTVSIKTAGQISYDITAQSAKGIYNTTSLGTGVTVSAAKGSSYKVTATSGDAYGIEASGAALNYGKVNNVAVSATGGKAYGFAATNGGKLSGDAAYKMQTLSVSSDKNAYGIYADGTNSAVSDARVGQLTVNSGGDAMGILAVSDGSVSADVDLMSVTGAAGNAFGIWGFNGSNVKLAMSGDMSVHSIGGFAEGINTKGQTSFSGVKSLNVSSDKSVAYGITSTSNKINGSLENMNVYGGGNDRAHTVGIEAEISGTVDLAMSGDLNVRGLGANGNVDGVYVVNDGAVTFTGVKNMTVSADGAGATARGINALNVAENSGTVSGDMQSLTVTSAHGAAYGVDVSNDKVSSIDIANGLTVSGATGGAGIYLTGARHSVNVGGALKATGVQYGIYNNGGTVDPNGINIVSSGYGIYTSGDQAVTQVSPTSKDALISADASGIVAESSGQVLIGKGDGTPLVINSGSKGIEVASGGLVSSDADLVIKSGADGVYNSGGTVNLAGVSIDVASAGSIAGVKTTGSGNTTISGDKALIKAVTSGSEATAYAIDNEGTGAVSVDVSGNIELTAEAKNGTAAAVSGSNITLKSGGQVSFDVTGLTAKGLYKDSAAGGATVDAAGGSNYKITATSGDAYGIGVSGSGNVLDYGKVNNVTVKATKGNAYGFAATSGGKLSGDFANGVSSVSVTADTDEYNMSYNYGVYASDGAVKGLSIDKLTVQTAGYGGNGVKIIDSSADMAVGSLTVNSDQNSVGVDAAGSDVNLALGDLKAASTYNDAYGVVAQSSQQSTNANLVFTGAKALTVSADNGSSYGVKASESSTVSGDAQSLTVSGKYDATGIRAEYNSKVQLALNGGMKVTSANGAASGIDLNSTNASSVNISDDLTVSGVTGDFGIRAKGAAHTVTVGGLTDVNIAAGGDNNAIYAADGSNVNLNGGASLDVTGKGDVNGIAANGGSVTVSGDKTVVRATTTGEGKTASAISNTGTGAVSIDTGAGGVEMIVSAVSGDAAAVSNTGGGTVSIKTAGQISYDVTAQSAKGLYKDGSSAGNITVSAAKGSSYKVTATSGNAYGIAASGDTTLAYGKVNNVTVNATGGDAYGLAATNGGKLSGDGANSIGNVSVTENTVGKNAYGVYAGTSGDVQLALSGDLAVKSANGFAYGTYADNSSVKFTGVRNLTVSADNGYGYGLYAMGDADNQLLGSVSGDAQSLTVNAASNAYGVYAGTSGDVRLALSGDLAVNSASGSATGAYADNSSVKFTGVRNLTVSADNGYGYGLYAINGSVSGDAQSLTVTSANGSAYGIGINSDKVSNINIAKDLTVKGSAGGSGITAAGAAHQITVGGLTDVSLKNGIYETNAIYANGAAIKLNGGLSADVAVTSPDTSAYGVRVENGGSVTTGSGGKSLRVDSASGSAYGIDISSDKVSTINIAKDLAVKGAAGGTGIKATGAAHQITVGGLTDVSIASYASNAIKAADGSNVNLNGGASLDVTGDGDVSGIKAGNGNVTVSGDKAIVKATTNNSGYAYAISNVGTGAVSVDVTGDIELTASAQNGYAAAVSGDNITLKAGGQASFDVTGLTAKGLYKDGSSQNLTVDAKGGSNYKVTSTNGEAYGLAASGAALNYGKVNNVAVSSTGGNAYGLAATNHGTLSGDGANSIANVSVTENTASKNAYGVYAYNGSSVTDASIDKLTVDSAGRAYGVNVDRSTATVSSADLAVGAMSVSGDMAAYGVNAYGGSVKLAMNGDMAVKTAGDDANGVYAVNSDVRFTGAQALTVSADNGGGDGIFAQNSSVSGDAQSLTVSANSSEYVGRGIHAWQSGDVKLALNGDLSVENKNGAVEGIRADNNSSVTFTGVKAMTVSGDNSGNSVEESGIVANSSTVSGDLTSLTVMASGGNARARGIYASNSDVKLALSGDLTVEGRSGVAEGIIASTNSDVKFTGVKAMSVSSGSGGAYGIQSYGSTVSGGLAAMTVAATGSAEGIHASDSGVVNLNAAGPVSVTSKNGSAYGININSGKASTINIAKDLTVKGAAGGAGVTAQGAAHQITVGGLTNVSVSKYGENGVYAADGANVNLNGGVSLDVTGAGDVSGIRAENGGKITVSGDKAIVKASTTGENLTAYAISNTGSGDITINNTGDVELTASSASGDAAAINNSGTGKVTVKTSGQVSFDVTGLTAKGLYNTTSQGAGVTVSADKGSSYAVTATSGDAYGLAASGDTTLAYGKVNNVTVSAAGGSAYGLAAINGATLSGDAKSAIGNITVTANAEYRDAYGVYAEKGGKVSAGLGDVTVRSQQYRAFGIAAVNGGSVDAAMNGGALSVSGRSYSFGIDAAGSSVTFTGARSVAVSSDAGDAYGVTAANGTVSGDLGGMSVYGAAGEFIDGVRAYSSDVKLAMDGSLDVSGGGTGMDGIEAGNHSKVAFTGVKELNVSGDTQFGTYGVNASDNSQVDGEAESLTVKSTGSAYGVRALKNSSADLSVTGAVKVATTGDSAYGVRAVNNSTVSADFGSLAVSASGDATGLYASTSSMKLSAAGPVSVTSANRNTSGIEVQNNSSVSADLGSLSVTAAKGAALGIYFNSDKASSIDITNGLTVRSAIGGAGIIASSYNSAAHQITVGGLTDVFIAAGGDNAIYAAGGSSIALNGGASLDVTGIGDVSGIAADVGNVTVSGDKAIIKASTTGDGATAYALNNTGSGDITINTGYEGVELTASSASGDAQAIGNSGTGSVTVTTSGQVSFDVTGLTAKGIYNTTSQGEGVSVSAAGGSNYAATATSGDAYGIAASGDNTLAYGKVNNVTVTATKGDAYGLAAINGATLSGDANSAVRNITVTENTAGKTAYGILASGDSTVKAGSIDAISVSSAGAGYGVLVSDNSKLTAKIGAITVNASNDAYGLYAPSSESKLDVSITGPVKVTTENGKAIGVYSASGGVTVSDDQAVITATSKGGDASAITPDSGDITVKETGGVDLTAKTDKGTATGVNVGTGKMVDVATGGVVSADATGASAYGFKAEKGNTAADSLINIAAGKDITIKAAATNGTAAGLYASGDIAKITYKADGALDLNVSNASGDAYGIRTANGGVISGEAAGGTAAVKSTGGSASGVEAISGSNVTVSGVKAMNVSSDAGYAYGVNADNSAANVGIQNMNVYSASSNAGGVRANSGDVTLAMNGDLAVNSAGGNVHSIAYGVHALDGGSVKFTGVRNLNVSADNGVGNGLYASNGSVSGDAQSLTVNSKSSAFGVGAVYSGDVQLALSGDLAVNSASGVAYGVDTEDSGSVKFTGVRNLNVSADNGVGYGLYSVYSGSVSGDAQSLTVTSANGSAYGIDISSDKVSAINIAKDLTVRGAAGGTGIEASGAAHQITVGGLTDVSIASNGDNAIYAANGSNVNLNGGVSLDVTGTGDVSGIKANGGNVTVSGDKAVVKASTTGAGAKAYALNNTGSGDVTIDTGDEGVELTAKAASGAAQAIGNSGTGSVTVTTTGQVSFDVTGLTAKGLYNTTSQQGAGVTVDAAGGSNYAVTATSGDAYGIAVSGDNTLAYGKVNNVNVTATKGDAYGLAAINGGILSGDANSAISNVTVTAKTADKTAFGLLASGDAAIDDTNIKQLTVTSAGNGLGVYAAGNSSVNVSADSVSVSAVNAAGIEADGSAVKADLGSLAVSASGTASGVSISSDQASSVNIASGLTVNSANGGTGIDVSGAAHQITVGGLTDVSIASNGDNAIYAANGSNVNLNGGVSLDVTGTGDVSGIKANGGNVAVSGDKAVVKASTTGAGAKAYALNNTGSGDITINTGDEGVELTASSVNGAAQAIGNSGTGKVTVKTSGQVSFDVTGLTAKGIYNTTSQGEGVSVSADQGSNYAVTATNGDAYGIAADGVALDYGKVNNVTVTATNGNAYGLLADNGGTLSGDTASPIKSLTVTANTAGYNAYGILASGDKSQADFGTVDKLTVTANGASGDAYGVYAKNDGGISGTVSGDLTVTAAGNAYGIYAPDKNSSADITVKGAVTATSAAGEATGVYAAGGGVRLSGPEAVVKATSGANSDAVALYPKSNDITLNESGDITLTANSGSGGAAYGAKVPDSRRLDLATEKSVSIDVTGGTKGAYGLYAESGAASSDITATAAKGAIRISAKATGGGAAYGLVTSGDGASISLSAQTISVDAAGGAIKADGGSVTVSADSRGSLAATGENAAVIYAANGASIDLTNIDAAAGTSGMLVIGSGDSTISAKNSILSGDIKHSDLTLGGLNKTNVMTLSLLNDTTFTGKANSPRIDINIDNTSAWNVTGNSSTEGVLSNAGGTVSFVNDGTDNTSSYSKVTVSKLQGTGGKYLMHADLESGKGDQITADTSDVSGTIAIVSPVKKGAYRARMAEDLVRITGDKNSSFTLSGDTYEYGAWKYALASEDISGSGLGWYLSNTQKVSSVTTAVLGSVVAPNIGRLEEGALYSQLGSIDYASADRNEARAWGYAIYSKFKYTDASSAPYEGAIADDTYAENKYYGLTGGMDKLVNATETGSFYAGAMMGYGEGDLDISGGDADDNSFHAGVYGIYRYNSGLYLAGIAKYNRYRTNVTARPEEGGAYRADYNQDGWSVSALAGKRFDLKNNWYAEPQAEIGYQRIGSASYEIGGSDIAIDSTNSVRARLGVAVGRKVTTESGKTLDFYVKASVLREFDGETNISINGDPFKTDFGGTWGQYKLGIDYWNADNFGARAAIVYENGEGYESPIGFELSLNWYTGPKQQKAETEETAPQEETKAETEAPAAKTE